MKHQLRALWHRATEVEKQQGRSWYREARSRARAISVESGVPLRRVVGIIAALSPRCRWDVNLRKARTAALGGEPGTFGFAKRKVADLLAGTPPLRVLRGPKERAFYRAILGDTGAVTIDTHCWRAVGGCGDRVRNYDEVARAYTEEALALGETPREFQAVIWVTQRNGAQAPLF